MPKMTKFPKTISVKIENPGTDDEYLDAKMGDDMAACAEVGEKIRVAIYELKEVRDVELAVVSNPAKQ